MVSKNNRIKRMEEAAERQSHFGIRKLTVGAASVLLGITLLFGANAKVARADETNESIVPTGNPTSSLERPASDQSVVGTVHRASVPASVGKQSVNSSSVATAVGSKDKINTTSTKTTTEQTITKATDKFGKQGVKQAAKQTVKTDQQAATPTSESGKQQATYALSDLDITNDSNNVGVIGKKDIENDLNVKSPAATIFAVNELQQVTPSNDKGGTIISDKNATTVEGAKKVWQDAYSKLNATVREAANTYNFTINKKNTKPIIEPAGTDSETTIKDLQDQAKKMTEQADQINKLIEQQKNDLTKWRENNKSQEDQFKKNLATWTDKFIGELQNRYGWSKDQINAFFGDDLGPASLIDANTCVDGKWTRLDDTGLTKAQLNKSTWVTLPSWVNTAEETREHLYELHVGDTFKYKNVFTDSKTNKDVDIKFTVTDLSGEKSGIFALHPKKLIWVRAAPSTKVPVTGLKAEFLEADTNNPIEINPIIGVGDIDYYQSLIIKNDQIRGNTDKAKNNNILFGRNVVKNSIQEIKDKKLNPYLVKDPNFNNDDIVLRNSDGGIGSPSMPGFQAWIRLKNTTSFNFSFGGGTFLENGTDEYEWALGNIGLPGLKPIMPPTKTADYSIENVIIKVDKDHPGDYKTTHTATRTISYQDTNGDKVQDANGKDINPVIQTVNFYGEGYEDLATGKLVTLDKDHHIGLDKNGKAVLGTLTWVGPDGKEDTGSWAGKTSPVVDGYHIKGVDKDSKNGVDVDPVDKFNHEKVGYTVTVTYEPNGYIIPVDPSGNPIPGIPEKQYVTDPDDPSKVVPDEDVPKDPNGKYTPDKDKVTPEDPSKDTPVVYNPVPNVPGPSVGPSDNTPTPVTPTPGKTTEEKKPEETKPDETKLDENKDDKDVDEPDDDEDVVSTPRHHKKHNGSGSSTTRPRPTGYTPAPRGSSYLDANGKVHYKLPQTGESDSEEMAAVLGGAAATIGLIGLAGAKKRRHE